MFLLCFVIKNPLFKPKEIIFACSLAITDMFSVILSLKTWNK